MNPYGSSSSGSGEEKYNWEQWNSHPKMHLKDVREVLEEEDDETWIVDYSHFVNEIVRFSRIIKKKKFDFWVKDVVKDVNKDLDLKDWSEQPFNIKVQLEFSPDGPDNSVTRGYVINILCNRQDSSPSRLIAYMKDHQFDYKDRLLVRYLYRKIQNVKDDRSFRIAMQSDKRLNDDVRGVIGEYIGGSKKDPSGVDPKLSSSFQGKSVW